MGSGDPEKETAQGDGSPWGDRLFSPEEFSARRTRFAAELAAQSIDIAAVAHPPDLFYLSGTTQASCLVLGAAGEAWLAARHGAARAQEESGLPVEEFADSGQLAAAVHRHHRGPIRRLGLVLDVLSYGQFRAWQRILPQAEVADLQAVLGSLRQIKSPLEVEFIRLAARQLDGALKTAASLLRLGQSELELAIRIEAYLRRKGHPGLVRVRRIGVETGMGFILAGPSTLQAPEFDALCLGPGLSPAVPFGPGDREFRAGEPVLFDYCGCCAGYIADQSRMLSIGRPPEEASWAYEAMRHLLRRLEAQLGPGQEAGRLYEIARREARLLGYEEQFMGSGGRQLPFVGHGVGLELNEAPILAKGRRDRLAPGMVVAIEPKVVLAGVGVVGVENTYLITESGFERLTLAEEEWRQVPVD